MAAGIGLDRLAEQIGRHKSHLSRVERGDREVTPALVRDYERALGTTATAEAGRQDVPREPTRSPTGRMGMDDEVSLVQRRQVLAGVAAAGGYIACRPHRAWLSAGRRVGQGEVNMLVARVNRQRRLDDYLGGPDTFEIYASELDATVRLYNEAAYGESIGRQLLALIAEQAQQAGWAAFDAGEHSEAGRLYRVSLSAAQQADAPLLAGNALAFLAYQASSTNRSGAADASESVSRVGIDAPGPVRALMLERLAWSYAVANQPAHAERALVDARDALAEGGGVTPDWARWVDHDELQIMAGRCWSELRRPLRAIPVLEDVLWRFDDTHVRDKALYLTWLAAAYLDANEFEQAAATAARADALAVHCSSPRPRERIDALVTRLKPHVALPAVRDLVGRAGG